VYWTCEAAGAADAAGTGVSAAEATTGLGVGLVTLGVGVDTLGEGSADDAAADAEAGGATVRSLKQYRHLMASSWISSAQYGHFFTVSPLGRGGTQG
jgi:hypothetical protein